VSLTPEEIRAAAETHGELGPEYSSAVIESFLDKVGKEIDARVDARVAGSRPPFSPIAPYPVQPPVQSGNRAAFALALISMVVGIPLTAIVSGLHQGLPGLLIIWVALVAINVSYGLHNRLPRGR
jgi:hypothetical protein